jgi:hypothetical protein
MQVGVGLMIVWWKLELAGTYLVCSQLAPYREVSTVVDSVGNDADDVSLQRFHQYYGEDLQVECPTGSGDVSSSIPASRRKADNTVHESRWLCRRDPASTHPSL